MRHATPIDLTAEERGTLENWVRASTTEQRLVVRARLILAAAEGASTTALAQRFKVRPATVSQWRGRFAAQRLVGLQDRPRPGPRPRYGAEVEKRIVALLDQPPPSGYASWSGGLLARALGDRLTAANADADEDRGRVKVGSAGAVLGDHLRTQRDALLARDPQARRDEPDAVHQMRVATRQLRSTLATFRPLLAREASEVVRVELGWLGEALGAARDAEVMRDLLAVHLTQAPAGLVGDVVTQRLDADRTQALTAARELLTQALDSARYFRLLDALDALVDAPPWTKAAARTAARALPPLVRRDWKRLARAYAAARQSPPGPRREALLHETRKAAKRARYAAEAAVPAVGRPAAKFARAAKDLQTLLGDHHDCVVLRDLLAQMGAQADVEGKNAFIYGRLYALEQARAEHLEAQLPAAWKRVSAKPRRRWLA